MRRPPRPPGRPGMEVPPIAPDAMGGTLIHQAVHWAEVTGVGFGHEPDGQAKVQAAA